MVIETARRIGVDQVHVHSNGNGHKAGEFIISSVPFVVGLEAEAAKRVDIVGRKGASLAELPGINVPEGFVIATASLQEQIIPPDGPGIKERVKKLDEISKRWVEANLSGNSGSIDEFWELQAEAAAEELRGIIEVVKLPSSIRDGIREMYGELCRKVGEEDVTVTVGNSRVDKDGIDLSSAGLKEIFIRKGKDEVADAVWQCLIVQFARRAVRRKNEARLEMAQKALRDNPQDKDGALEKSEILSYAKSNLAIVVQRR